MTVGATGRRGQDDTRTSAEPAFLSVREITKRFGELLALRHADLEIVEGEFLTLLGPSGCGKTTLLRIIGGFERPDGGTVAFRGRDLVNAPPERRPFNMVFQSYALFPHMSVKENVAYGLRAAGVAGREIAARVREMLELVHLDAFADRPVRELSGGQQQRVALGRALVNEPAVLLLDEPLAALDLQLRKQLQDELRAIQRRLGTTFVYVTHDQEEALTLSQRVVLMNEGELIQVGTPRDVYERPHTRFVAEFIGETNVIPCNVVAVDDQGCTVRFPGGATWPLRHFGESDLQAGQPALAIVRPEHVEITDALDAPFSGALQETVFLGPVCRHVVRLDDGTTVRVLVPAHRASGTDARMSLSINHGAGVVVPEESSKVSIAGPREAS